MSTKVKQELLETGETLFCCPQCPFKADKLQMTKVHMMRHSGQFVCQKCKKSCRSQKDLKSHMKNVHKEPTVDEAIQHKNDNEQQLVVVKTEGNEVTPSTDRSRLGKRRKKEANKGQYQCQYCDYTADRQILLNQHCKYHMNSSFIKHLCPACFKPFPSPYHVKRHIRYNHPDTKYSLIKLEPKKEEAQTTPTTPTKSTPVTSPTKSPLKKKRKKIKKAATVVEVRFRCFLTNFLCLIQIILKETPKTTLKSSKKKKLSPPEPVIAPTPAPAPAPMPAPIKTSRREPFFQCAHCKYSTNSKNSLRQHMTYHSEKYLCKICAKPFPCARRLNLHIERIHDQVRVKEEEFDDDTNDNNNKENEDDEEMLVKNEITSSLWGFDLSDFGIDAIVLNDEMISEDPPQINPILPHVAPNNVFPNDFHVQTENTNATEDSENPFSCPFCPYRGKKKRNLDSHMVYHTDKFKCETCSKRHPTLYHLNRHIRLVHCGNPEESFPKQERDEDQQSSPSLYFPSDSNGGMKEESSECSLPFNLTDLMSFEATEDLNGTIKLEPCSDDESPPRPCDEEPAVPNPLSALNDIQFTLPNEIQFSIQPDGQKIFFCSDCSYTNTKKQNVKQHRKIHTPLHACQKCGKGHTTSFHLKRHLIKGNCNTIKEKSPKKAANSKPRKRVKKIKIKLNMKHGGTPNITEAL